MKNRNFKSSTGRLSWMLSDVLKSKRAEGYVDTAVKVLIAVVIGALLLFGLYGLMNNVVIPTTTSKVISLFKFEGDFNGGTEAGGAGSGGTDIPSGSSETKRDGIIPDGASYETADGRVLTGDGSTTFPAPQTNDVYKEGGYIYTYGKGIIGDVDYGSNWCVELEDKSATEAGVILSEVMGKPVNNMAFAFYGCSKLKTAPAIPGGVTTLQYAFENCISLEKVPTIPSSVVNMSRAFAGCKALTDASNISKATAAEDMSYTFWNCTSLVNAPDIPGSVKNMDSTFSGCTKLAGTIKIDANPDTYVSCLFWAKGITEITGSTTLKTEILATR